MKFPRIALFGCLLCLLMPGAQAESTLPRPQTKGVQVVIPAYGEVRHANDEARATFMVEEQDREQAAAASRVNRRMKEGTELLHQQDRSATLQTRGYYAYPVYGEEPDRSRSGNKSRQPVAWRVGQYLDMITGDIEGLPRTVATVQRMLALNGLSFGLATATSRQLEEQRIAAAYQNFTERLAAIAKTMGRSAGEAEVESVDLDGSGAQGMPEPMAAKALRGMAAAPMQVEEPRFEPGETTLGMRLVGKVRFR